MKPGVAAQVLSPAALTMAALSMWPEPTRLAGGREMLDYCGNRRDSMGIDVPDGEVVVRTSSQHKLLLWW